MKKEKRWIKKKMIKKIEKGKRSKKGGKKFNWKKKSVKTDAFFSFNSSSCKKKLILFCHL